MNSYTNNLSPFDWMLIVAYVLATLGIAVWTKIRSKRTTEEYLMAGRSMNWIIVAIAVFATLFSTISFVSVPGEGYNYGMFMWLPALLNLLFLPLAVGLFLRFFFMAPTFTAYEYLEKRYCPSCRRIGSLMFIILRIIYAGCVFYSASVIFQSLVGWHPLLTISIIGAITVAYTVTGGIKAVIMADVMQSGIILLGIVAILYKLLDATGFDFATVFSFAHRHDHTFELLGKPEFYRLDLHDRWNFWLMLPGLILTPMMTLSCDQLVIQRLLTSKDYKRAKRSTYLNYLMGLPVVGMLYVIGVLLFYFYNSGAKHLPDGVNGDQVMGYFINTELPAPLPGLIVAALLAALMSTVAGVVNSLATVCWKDIIVSFKPELANSPSELKWCYLLSIIMGFVGIGIAAFLAIAGDGVKTSLLEVVGIWSSLWTVLFVAFLYGVLSTRVSAKAILITLVIGGIIQIAFPYYMYYCVPATERWGFWWLGFPGMVISMVLPPLLSLIWPNKKDLTDLTLWTLSQKNRKMQTPAPEKLKETELSAAMPENQ